MSKQKLFYKNILSYALKVDVPFMLLTESEKGNVMDGAVYLVGIVQKAGTKMAMVEYIVEKL